MQLSAIEGAGVIDVIHYGITIDARTLCSIDEVPIEQSIELVTPRSVDGFELMYQDDLSSLVSLQTEDGQTLRVEAIEDSFPQRVKVTLPKKTQMGQTLTLRARSLLRRYVSDCRWGLQVGDDLARGYDGLLLSPSMTDVATVEWRAELPEGFHSVSNPPGRWAWPSLHFGIGPFKNDLGSVTSIDGRRIPLVFVHHDSTKEVSRERVTQAFRHLEQVFGAYPLGAEGVHAYATDAGDFEVFRALARSWWGLGVPLRDSSDIWFGRGIGEYVVREYLGFLHYGHLNRCDQGCPIDAGNTAWDESNGTRALHVLRHHLAYAGQLPIGSGRERQLFHGLLGALYRTLASRPTDTAGVLTLIQSEAPKLYGDSLSRPIFDVLFQEWRRTFLSGASDARTQFVADDYRTPNPLVDVQNYRLELDLRDVVAHGDENRMSCVAAPVPTRQRLTLVLQGDAQHIDLHFNDQASTLLSLTADGKPLRYELQDLSHGHRFIRVFFDRQLGAGETLVLDAETLFEPSREEALPRDDYQFRPGVFDCGWSSLHFNPYIRGMRALAVSHDDLSDAASVEWILRVPDGFVAAANGTLVRGDLHTGVVEADGSRVFHWRLEEPVYPALFTFFVVSHLAGAGALAVDYVTSVTGAQIPVQYWASSKDLTPSASTTSLLPRVIAFMEHAVAPYPFQSGKIGVWMEFGGMEFATLLTGGAQERTLVHELVHSWFGNAVRPANWGNAWLSEGFTTYFTDLYLGDALAWPDECATQCPLNRDPMDEGLIYFAGAQALAELRALSGNAAGIEPGSVADEAHFLALLRAYFHAFQWKAVDSVDFVNFVERETATHYGVFDKPAFEMWKAKFFRGL